MSRLYKLLRNNKETGPFSLEELEALGLKNYDLIWIEGRSAGWRYPSEIKELEHITGERNDPSGTLDIKERAIRNEERSILTEPNEVKPKSSRRIFVRLPGGFTSTPASIPTTIATSISQDQETKIPEEKLNLFADKAEQIRQRALNYAEIKSQEEEPETETRYSRSLQDIKQEYSTWMQLQKKKNKFQFKKIHLGFVVFIAVLAIASFAYFNGAQKSISFNESMLPPVSVITDTVKNHSTIKKTPTKKSAKKKNTRNPPVKKSQNSPEMIKNDGSEPLLTAEPKPDDTIIREPGAAIVKKETNRRSLPLPKLISVSANQSGDKKSGIQGLTITVENKSEESLKLVAVDVIYYRKNQKVLEKKTLYFSNILPGGTITLKAPDQKKAVSAGYKLGLISTDSGSLYVLR